MSDPVIEIIKLKNGDIALRHPDSPEHYLVTISFSEQVQAMLQGAQLEIAQSMIQAGMDSFRKIQLEQLSAARQTAERGLLH